MFDFKHIQPFNRNLIKSPDPMILFATPGMLHGGTSLQVFTEWCSEEKNCIIIPGYCVAGTLGNKLLKGIKKYAFITPVSISIKRTMTCGSKSRICRSLLMLILKGF